MTRTQIECFKAVYETHSVTKAANTLYISQPAISKSISKLEEELGFSLFDRSGGALLPSEAGECFFSFLEKCEEAFLTMTEEVRSLQGASGGTLRIGVPETWNPDCAADVLEECFAEVLPGYRLQLEACRLSELLTRLAAGRLDAVLSHDFCSPALPGIVSRTIAQTGCGILYSKKAFGSVLSAETFRTTPYLLFDSDMERRFRRLIRGIAGGEGPVKSCLQLQQALFETARGTGVMLFSDWDSAISNRLFGYLALPEKLPVHLYYPEEGNREPVDRLAEALIKRYGEKE